MPLADPENVLYYPFSNVESEFYVMKKPAHPYTYRVEIDLDEDCRTWLTKALPHTGRDFVLEAWLNFICTLTALTRTYHHSQTCLSATVKNRHGVCWTIGPALET